ncbi:hypothetical protein LPJGGPFB_04828 [Ensifer adhaerens]|uniref:hypothetical protein n=1 Tax=Ensifer adhaerens TaxID=106592 RepID=UPI0031F424FC|nr:hypothetical protein [Ensifer adhaerens]
MVNVEADVMVGPILAEKARAKGLIYSMAYGDQPALICELVDWARATGFESTSARGHEFRATLPLFHAGYSLGSVGWTEEQVAADNLSPKLYNSFTDSTKAAIEMAAVANGTGLDCADDIGTRLQHTFNTLTNVRPDGFSDRDLGDRYERLFARLTDKEAETEEDGATTLTLPAMSEQEAADAAHEIV